eukprot:TRINITY_DN7700_c2_g1_i1.p1 TRINITY_DN7700_c2_g1~~TRINITY_DN7700_c2_g1_i1.p1  ORF type:complete len:106 (-),score=2.68 TRINITY_DN7700_c2_g1_i1:13-300(-)
MRGKGAHICLINNTLRCFMYAKSDIILLEDRRKIKPQKKEWRKYENTKRALIKSVLCICRLRCLTGKIKEKKRKERKKREILTLFSPGKTCILEI